MRDNRRLMEWGKNALILLLTLSAGVLLSMTPLARDSGLGELLRPRPAQTGTSGGGSPSGPVLPARLAVYREGGRFGLQYDDNRMEEVFAAFVPLLGDALAGAGEPSPLPEAQWRDCLGRRGAYFDFAGEIPLAALARWLGGGACPLEGSARRVALVAGEGDAVSLCWENPEGGGGFTCPTALSRSLHLDPAVDAVSPNGAYFAFEDEGLSRLLDPLTLITEGEPAAGLYSVTAPLSTTAGTEALLDALSFNSQNHAPGSNGEVYLDGADRLVIRDGSTVTYRAAQEGKYPVENTNGSVSAAQAAQGARALAERAMAPLCGEARLYLLSVRPEGEGWRVRFGFLLGGSSVYLYDEGWAAEFLVRDGCVTGFTLRLRQYAALGENALLLPIRKAAAMLPDLTRERRELVIQYRDGGGSAVSPGWEAV